MTWSDVVWARDKKDMPHTPAILFGGDRCALCHPACRAHSSSVPLSASARLKKDSTDECMFQWSPSKVKSGDHLDSCTCLVMQTLLRGSRLI